MPKFTEIQELSILQWSQQTKDAVAKCTEEIAALGSNKDKMTIDQAKMVEAWNIIFIKLKIKIKTYELALKSKRHLMTTEVFNAITDIVHAIRFVREMIIPKDLRDKAAAALQKSSSDDNDDEYYAESSDQDSDSCASQKYMQRLNDLEIQGPQQMALQKGVRWLIWLKAEHHKPNYTERLQEGTGWLLDEMKRHDQNVLVRVRDCTRKNYEDIKRHHEAFKFWKEIVKGAHADADKQSDHFFTGVRLERTRQNEIKNGFLKGFASILMSPFLLHYFADPIFKMTHHAGPTVAATSASGVSTGIAVIFMSLMGTQDSPADKCQKMVEDMIEQEPFGFAENFDKFLQYKLNGVAKEVFNVFSDHSTLLNGLSPQKIIAAVRMQVIKEMNAERVKKDVELFQQQPVYWGGRTASQILNNEPRAMPAPAPPSQHADLEARLAKVETHMMLGEVEGKVATKICDSIDRIFKTIKTEYPADNYILQIQALYKALGFDDTKAGMNSVKSSKLKELRSILSKHLHIRMVLMYAAIYVAFFGGHKTRPNPLNFFNAGFDPGKNNQFGVTLDESAKNLLNHLIELFDTNTQKEFRSKWKPLFDNNADLQNKRKILLSLLSPYINDHEFHNLLAKKVFDFAKFYAVNLKKVSLHDIKHTEWIPEEELRKTAETLLSPLIQEAKDKETETKHVIKWSRKLVEEQALLHRHDIIKAQDGKQIKTKEPNPFISSIVMELNTKKEAVIIGQGSLSGTNNNTEPTDDRGAGLKIGDLI